LGRLGDGPPKKFEVGETAYASVPQYFEKILLLDVMLSMNLLKIKVSRRNFCCEIQVFGQEKGHIRVIHVYMLYSYIL